MSKDIVYPMLNSAHPVGTFNEVPLPESPGILTSISGHHWNMVPVRVALDGSLHYGVFAAPKASPVTDLVFRVHSSDFTHDAFMIHKFFTDIRAKLVDHHAAMRQLSRHEGVDYVFIVIRFYTNDDFECSHHPEFFLGEPTRPYLCPVCQAMQISGTPHIGEDHE